MSFDRTQSLKDHMSCLHNTVPSFSVQSQPLIKTSTLDGLYCHQCKNPFANKYSLMKHLRSTKCKMEDESSINRVINDQLTCPKCKHQFGSVQAYNKHAEGRKCLEAPSKPHPQKGIFFRILKIEN